MRIRQMAAGTVSVIVLTGTAACSSDKSSASPFAKSTSSAAGSTTKSTGTKKPGAGKTSTLKGIDFCKKLSPESLAAIGVQASDAKPRDKYGKPSDSGCEWETGATKVGVYAIYDWSIAGTDADRTFTLSGFAGKEGDSLGNSCDESMQVNEDELELNVENDDSSNEALKGKACDVARGFVQQVLAGVPKK